MLSETFSVRPGCGAGPGGQPALWTEPGSDPSCVFSSRSAPDCRGSSGRSICSRASCPASASCTQLPPLRGEGAVRQAPEACGLETGAQWVSLLARTLTRQEPPPLLPMHKSSRPTEQRSSSVFEGRLEGPASGSLPGARMASPLSLSCCPVSFPARCCLSVGNSGPTVLKPLGFYCVCPALETIFFGEFVDPLNISSAVSRCHSGPFSLPRGWGGGCCPWPGQRACLWTCHCSRWPGPASTGTVGASIQCTVLRNSAQRHLKWHKMGNNLNSQHEWKDSENYDTSRNEVFGRQAKHPSCLGRGFMV